MIARRQQVAHSNTQGLVVACAHLQDFTTQDVARSWLVDRQTKNFLQDYLQKKKIIGVSMVGLKVRMYQQRKTKFFLFIACGLSFTCSAQLNSCISNCYIIRSQQRFRYSSNKLFADLGDFCLVQLKLYLCDKY